MEDRHQMRIDTNSGDWHADQARDGVTVLELYSDHRERVSMERWQPGQDIMLDSPEGLEVLVVEGSFNENSDLFENQSWLRLPPGSSTIATAGKNGCKVWIKRDHLKEPPAAPSV